MATDTTAYQTTIRLDPEDRQLLERLAKHAKLKRSDVVRTALRRMAAQSGLTRRSPDTPPLRDAAW